MISYNVSEEKLLITQHPPSSPVKRHDRNSEDENVIHNGLKHNHHRQTMFYLTDLLFPCLKVTVSIKYRLGVTSFETESDSADISSTNAILILGILIDIIVILICWRLLRRIVFEFPELKDVSEKVTNTHKTVHHTLDIKCPANTDQTIYDDVESRNREEGIENLADMGKDDRQGENMSYSDVSDDDLNAPPVIDWSEIPEGDPDPSCIPDWAIIPKWEQKY